MTSAYTVKGLAVLFCRSHTTVSRARCTQCPRKSFNHSSPRTLKNRSVHLALHSSLGSLALRNFSRCGSRRVHWTAAAFAEEGQPPWTLDQVAGLAFAAFVLLCVYLAKEVDTIIARSQRRELGLCEECGGLFEPDTCEEWRCPLKDNL